MSKQIYYCNRPCEVITDLGDESVIKIATHIIQDCGSYDEPPYSDPLYDTLIVANHYLRDNIVDWEKDLDAQRKQIASEKEEAMREIAKERREAAAVTSNTKARFAKLKGIELALDVLEGEKDLWVLENSSLSLYQLSELAEDDYGIMKLKSVIIKRHDSSGWAGRGRGFFFVAGRYVDSDSGSPCQIFETKGDALDGARKIMMREKHWSSYIGFCKKHGVQIDEVDEVAKELATKKDKKRRESIKKVESALKALKSGTDISNIYL